MQIGHAVVEKVYVDAATRMRTATAVVQKLASDLTPFQLRMLTALPHICSRICHPHKDVNKILKDIMVKLPKVHEQQTMWMLLAVSKSTAQDPEDPVQRRVPAGQEPKAGAVDSRGL